MPPSRPVRYARFDYVAARPRHENILTIRLSSFGFREVLTAQGDLFSGEPSCPGGPTPKQLQSKGTTVEALSAGHAVMQ